jgi:ATP-dependent exoDNAse (exonuclease V) beta subunit
MTIHKAKGLEFDFVVIADATWRPRSAAAPLYLLDETGPALKFDRLDASPLIYRLAGAIEAQQAQAESGRLLYVAATRAKEKLIISGHLSLARNGVRVDGWLKELLEAMEENASHLAQNPSVQETTLPGGEAVRLWIGQQDLAVEGETPEKLVWPESKHIALFDHRAEPEEDAGDPDLDEWSPPDWRATGEMEFAPAVAVGKMVHAALQAWLFPGDSQLDSILRTTALREGVVDPGQLERALEQSHKLLERLRGHSLCAAIESAAERAHEIPYTLELADGRIDSGIIDLLYRSEDGWHLIDFKTDFLDAQEKLEEAIEEHRPQIARYALAIDRLLGVQPKASICFLDALGEADVVEI